MGSVDVIAGRYARKYLEAALIGAGRRYSCGVPNLPLSKEAVTQMLDEAANVYEAVRASYEDYL